MTGKSVSFKAEELHSARRLQEEIRYLVGAKASAIRSLNEKLKNAYEELDTFSLTVSHDLKNPISVIKSYSQLLSNSATMTESERRILRKITDRTDQMNLMITEILDYSRIGREEIEFKKINTRSLLEEIVKGLEIIYGMENSEIRIGLAPDLYGDPMMISQVFTNLISNAVKYSQNSKPSAILISGLDDDGTVTYQIRDNGMGIPEKELPTIFALFKRMSNVGDIEGTGVGLAIVKRIIERHRGTIWVESKLGLGTTFFLSFVKAQHDENLKSDPD